MTYDEKKIKDKIDSTIIDYMNGLPHLMGKTKRVVELRHVHGKARYREFVVCRQMAIYLCDFIFNDILKLHFTEEYIGSFYGKDHSTVWHSKETIRNYQETTPQILTMTAYCMDSVLNMINGDNIDQDNPNWYTKFYHEHATI